MCWAYARGELPAPVLLRRRERIPRRGRRDPVGAVALAPSRRPPARAPAAGAAPATLNNLRAQLRTVFAKAKKAGRWFGATRSTVSSGARCRRRLPHALSRADGKMLAEVPRTGVLSSRARLSGYARRALALRKSDVDLARGTITVARSHERDTTKVVPQRYSRFDRIATLDRVPARARTRAPGLPRTRRSQRTREADPQKILRHALARAGIVEGYDTAVAGAPQGTRQRCGAALLSDVPQVTDGRAVHSRGTRRRLWPVALHIPSASTTAPHLRNRAPPPRSGLVRVQRLMRHSDVRVTPERTRTCSSRISARPPTRTRRFPRCLLPQIQPQ